MASLRRDLAGALPQGHARVHHHLGQVQRLHGLLAVVFGVSEGLPQFSGLVVDGLLDLRGGHAVHRVAVGALEGLHRLHHAHVVAAVHGVVVEPEGGQVLLELLHRRTAHALGELHVHGRGGVGVVDLRLELHRGHAAQFLAHQVLGHAHGVDGGAVILAADLPVEQAQIPKAVLQVQHLLALADAAEGAGLVGDAQEALVGEALAGVVGLLKQQLPQALLALAALDDAHLGARGTVLRDELGVLPAQAHAAVGGREAEVLQAGGVDGLHALLAVGDGVEQHLAPNAGGIFHPEVADAIPGLAVGALTGFRQDVLAHGRPVVQAGGAEHLPGDLVGTGDVDGDDLAGDVHLDAIGQAVVRRCAEEAPEGRQRQDDRHRQCQETASLHAFHPRIHPPRSPLAAGAHNNLIAIISHFRRIYNVFLAY